MLLICRLISAHCRVTGAIFAFVLIDVSVGQPFDAIKPYLISYIRHITRDFLLDVKRTFMLQSGS